MKKISDKKRKEIFENAKTKKLPQLRRKHDYHIAIFISFVTATILSGFNFIKNFFTTDNIFSKSMITEFIIFWVLFLLVLQTIKSERLAYLPLRVREEKLQNSKEKANLLIDEILKN